MRLGALVKRRGVGRTAMRLGALVMAIGLAGCGGGAEEDPLASLTIIVPQSRLVLVTLPVNPDRPMSVSQVEVSTVLGLEADYAGYVTDCGDLCGVNEFTEAEVERLDRVVEGTVPFRLEGSQRNPLHLLFVLRVTDEGARFLREDEGACLAVRDVRLRLDEGETISVRREGLRFLWVLATSEDPSCLDLPAILRG